MFGRSKKDHGAASAVRRSCSRVYSQLIFFGIVVNSNAHSTLKCANEKKWPYESRTAKTDWEIPRWRIYKNGYLAGRRHQLAKQIKTFCTQRPPRVC